MVDISVFKRNLLEIVADAIVNSANSLGLMGGGVAAVIKKAGGEEIERRAMAKAPIEVGRAVSTTAGKLPFKAVIHAPTMEMPAMKTTVEKVRDATRAALEVADDQKFSSIAFPGMGTGIGGVKPQEAAQGMVEVIKAFKPLNLKTVYLVAPDEELYEAFKKAVGGEN